MLLEIIEEWIEIHKILSYWELEISDVEQKEVYDILLSQKKQANKLFAEFINKNYEKFLKILDNAKIIIHLCRIKHSPSLPAR